MDYTKVNIGQLEDLKVVMDLTKTATTQAIEKYEVAIASLANSGEIAGTALEAFDENITKVRTLSADFETYCEEVRDAIDNIITTSTEIEKKYTAKYEELFSKRPEDFNI